MPNSIQANAEGARAVSSIDDVSCYAGREEPPLALMVTDLEAFTPMVESLGDVAAQRVLQTHNQALRICIGKHNGAEIAHTGDGMIASFRSVVNAVACATDVQRAIAVLDREVNAANLRIRVGLHAGHPLPEEGRLFGIDVIAATRIATKYDAGHIIASSAVYALAGPFRCDFAPLGAQVLKGIRDPVPLFDLRWQEPSTRWSATHSDRWR